MTTPAPGFISPWRKIRELLLHSNLLWYGLTASLISGIPILLLPFLIQRLPAASYAHVVSMQIIAMFGGLLIAMGMDGSVARDALRARSRHLATHVVIALGVQLAVFALLSGAVLVFGDKLAAWIDYPVRWLWPTLFGCLLQQVTFFTANLMRLQGRVAAYAALSVGQAALEIGLSLGLLYTVVPDWEARLAGFVGASAVTAAGALILLTRLGLIRRPRHLRRVLKRMLNYGLPTLPHSLFSLLSAWADRFILIRFCGAAIAGVYSAAAQSVFVINFTGSIINLAWTPWLYQRLSDRRALAAHSPAIRRAATLQTALLAGIGTIMLGLLLAYFRWLAPPAYRDAIPFLPYLALGAAANAIYKVLAGFLFFQGKTRYLAGVAFLILLFSLAAQIVFVPKHQGFAAASIFALVNLIQMSCVWLMAGRIFPHLVPFFGRAKP